MPRRWPATCPLKVINDGEVTALTAVKKIEAGSVMKSPWAAARAAVTPTRMETSWVGSMSSATAAWTSIPWQPPSGAKGHRTGISHRYLVQRIATKLAAKGGVDVPPNYVYPHEAEDDVGVPPNYVYPHPAGKMIEDTLHSTRTPTGRRNYYMPHLWRHRAYHLTH